MNWNKHSEIDGAHSFLSPSNYHWLNYDDNKLMDVYRNTQAIERGTKLHDFAARCIELGQKLPRSQKTLNIYVNDAIGYGMTPEVGLVYSANCFGHADSICFRNKLLRIHDYKTGETKASFNQLRIYAALFCLEYRIAPCDIDYELRLYQYDNFTIDTPNGTDIAPIMDKIVRFDKIITQIKQEGEK